MEATNNMDVEGQHNPAAAYSAPSTAASTAASITASTAASIAASKAESTATLTAAAWARPMTLFQLEGKKYTLVAAAGAAAATGTATGANLAATALSQQTTPFRCAAVARTGNFFRQFYHISALSVRQQKFFASK